jgi:cellulose synthase/poly-beta-1,6-N-acetylglucosamine synthase-like glycosyltransferase
MLIMMGILFWLCVLLLFYIYAGYPIALALLGWLFNQSVKAASITPDVALVIAAYNEEAVIAEKIENCLKLEYPREHLQIIVAADGSDDRTVEIVKSFSSQGVKLSYSQERLGKMAAVNRALSRVDQEIVVFSDANNMYKEDTLLSLIKPFADSQVGGATGSKQIYQKGDDLGKSDGLYWRYESFIKKQESRLGSCVGAVGEIFAIRRNLFVPPDEKIINDDFWIAMQIVRQGYRVLYIPEARSFEHASSSEKDEITRRTRIVAGRYQAMIKSFRFLPQFPLIYIWQIISHKYLRPLVPLLMFVSLLTNLIALLYSPGLSKSSLLYLSGVYGWIFITIQFLFYFSAWLGSWLKKRGVSIKLFYLPTFLFNSNWATLLGFIRFVTGKQTVVWQRVSREE